jgi:GMP synthase-like glutamine amidotransferase
MKPLLAIEQDERLPGLGLLESRLEASGLPARRIRVWEEELDGARASDWSGIVALGGNAHAWEEDEHAFLSVERRLLADAVAEGVPVLGICLGAQVLARALGAEVRTSGVHEAGWLDITPAPAADDDPILGHLEGPTGVFHWHHDTFDLPDGAARLASSELTPNQAFRLGDAWGIQFHPEVDYPTFAFWQSNHPGACEELGIDERGLHAAVLDGDRRTIAWRSRMFDAFLELVCERSV